MVQPSASVFYYLRNPRREGHGDGRGGRDARDRGDRRDSRDGRRRSAGVEATLDAVEPVLVRRPVVEPVIMEQPAPSEEAREAARAALNARREESTAAGSIELGGSVANRGRTTTRHPSPRYARRLSHERQSPPPSPTSPVSVLPSSAASRKAGGSLMEELDAVTRALCTPTSMLRPLRIRSPESPPGFGISSIATTPLFVPASLGARTPPSTREDLPSFAKELGPLFAPVTEPLLSRPADSPPPRRLTARRKTLAIHRTGFNVRRSSSRIKDKRHANPIVKEAEGLVCRNLGIVMDGKVVTEKALEVFVRMFKNQVSSEAVQALRVLFKLDSAQDRAVEDAMLARGGAAALEQFAADRDMIVDNV